MGFFRLKISSLASSYGLILTYIIVLLQFKFAEIAAATLSTYAHQQFNVTTLTTEHYDDQ